MSFKLSDVWTGHENRDGSVHAINSETGEHFTVDTVEEAQAHPAIAGTPEEDTELQATDRVN